MNIEDPDSDEDGEGDEEHAEQEVLAEEGYSQGGGGDDLSKQQEEHGQGQQDGNAKSYLLSKMNAYLDKNLNI